MNSQIGWYDKTQDDWVSKRSNQVQVGDKRMWRILVMTYLAVCAIIAIPSEEAEEINESMNISSIQHDKDINKAVLAEDFTTLPEELFNRVDYVFKKYKDIQNNIWNTEITKNEKILKLDIIGNKLDRPIIYIMNTAEWYVINKEWMKHITLVNEELDKFKLYENY